MKSLDTTEQIKEAIRQLQATADAANGAASSVTNLVLNHHPSLIADATIVRESSTLLQHVAQNFSRTALAALQINNPDEK